MLLKLVREMNEISFFNSHVVRKTILYSFFFILTIWFIVESGEYELITFFFLVRCYEQLWYSILVLGVGRIMIKKV